MLNTHELYLSGGGDENQSSPLDSFFFKNLPVNGKFLYIPIALRGNRLYETVVLWIEKVIALHQREDVTFELWDSIDDKTYSDIAHFDAIYIGGGNTWSLMKEFKAVHFDEAIRTFLKEKGPVYGGSAGAIIMGKRIDTQDDENSIGWVDMDGFGMVNNYSIACHFHEEQHGKFRDWSLSHKLPILCLSEETGVVITASDMRCVGTKSCYIYRPDGTVTNLSDGEHITFAKE
jgi:dipeptidase E